MSSAINLSVLLTQVALRHRQHRAVLHGNTALSWHELDSWVQRLAGGLHASGVRPGQAVIIQCRNSPQMIAAMWAVLRAGAVLVPVNFRLTHAEIAYMAEVTGARTLIMDPEFETTAAALTASGAIQIVIPTWPGTGWQPDVAGLTASATPLEPVDVTYDSPAWYFFTSGTTGRPKAAVLTHGQLAFVITNHITDLMPDLRAGDLSIALAPLSHGAGLHMLVNAARGSGTLIPATESFDAGECLRLIEEHSVSNLFAVPTMVKALADHPDAAKRNLKSLRHVVYAGAPMYRADQVRALRVLGPVLVQYYGLVEVTGNITVLPPGEHSTDDASMRVGSCGHARTGMEIQIVDPETRAPVATGLSGEICARGPAVFAGYLGQPQATERVMRDGWFHTGDVGHLDEAGYLHITGRLSDMYISGGTNIYPREIEEQLLTHEGVAEAAVFGVPDRQWGEAGLAVVVPRPGASLSTALLIEFLRPRLAGYKIPRCFEFVDAIPKTAYGKVSKADLRRRFDESTGA